MNTEEKNAVEFVKKRTKELKKYAKRENELVYDDIILNLIEKLQKENEELKDFKKQVTDIKSTNFIKYKNYIQIQKVKDKIRHYQELQDNYIKKYDEINEGLQAMINALQELIEEREEKAE